MQKFYDLARVFSSTTGTSSLLLGNAVPGYLTFAGAGASDGDAITYSIRDGVNSEIGRGTLSYSGGLWYLNRTTVLQSTNADAKISCTGAQEVFVTFSSMDIADLVALVNGTAEIGAWKRWRVRNIINAASSPYTHISKLRFKLSGTAATPNSVAYSDNAVSPANLFAGTGDWHCLGPGWIEAIWTTAQAFDQISLEATATAYGSSAAYPPVGLEIWVSNDGLTYFPVTVIDQTNATIGTSGNTIDLPTTFPWAAGSGGGPSLPTGGTAGQILTKQSSTDGDADWADNSKALSQLTDVNLGTPAAGQYLMFDNTSGKWVNSSDPTLVHGSSVPGTGSHRYWRLYNMYSAGNNVSLNEIQFRTAPGGSRVAATSVTASSNWSGSLTAVNVNDGNTSTGWATSNADPGSAGTGWIAFDFGSAKNFVLLTLIARADAPYYNQGPTDFLLQYSDDNATWTTFQHFTGLSWASAGQSQSFSLAGGSGYGLGLADLYDIDIGSVADGDVLVYDNVTGLWTATTIHLPPTGGSTGDVLTKNSGADYDFSWAAPTGGGGGGTSGTGAITDPHAGHTAWRVLFLDTQEFPTLDGGGYATVSYITFKDRSGSAISTSGAILLDYGSHGSYPIANLFDGSTSNIWSSQNTVKASAPAGGGVIFSSAKDVGSIDIRAADSYLTHSPRDFVIQYSDDNGQTWTNFKTVQDTSSWSSGQTRNYTLGTNGSAFASLQSDNAFARLKDRFSPPPAASFSTLVATNSQNPSIATKSDGSCVFDFGISPASGDNNRCALKSISGTWTIIARLEASMFDYDYTGGGLYLRNSSSGKLISWGGNGGGNNGLIQWNNWTNETTFSATPFVVTPMRNTNWEWFKIVNDGTNLSGFVSIDGDSWIKCGQVTLASFISSVDQVGFGIQVSHINPRPASQQAAYNQQYPYSGTSEGFVHVFWYSDPDITP